jgi:hypothetical protein
MDDHIERARRHERAANEIFRAIQSAEADGFELTVKHGWALDLHDKKTGKTTPLVGVKGVTDG